MDLSKDLISKFVKITNDADKQKPKEGTVYGTAVKYDGGIYVKIDGSDLLTPVDTTADIQDGERVTITIKDHNATVTGNITSPSTNEGVVTKKVTEAVDGIEDKVITEVETLVADRVSTKELDAEVARIDELIAGKATIEDLEATNAKIDNLEVGDLKAINAEIENLKANKAEIGDLNATNATIDTLDAKVANIDTLVNGNLTSDNILSFNITSKNTTMEDAFIKDAMIDRITANKIMSGTIDTNNVVIQSTDGSMLLQGNILQMKDESGKVRIQIGKDTGGNFTFVLYDESGKGVLIDEEGIKSSDAIADGLIVDAKVADNANISGSKLDIASVITEVNKDNSTTIKSNKIYLDGQNQSLEVAFNSLKSQVETIQDVTIDGDLSSIVEQVQSNTTKIEANKEGINTLVAENVIRTEEISDLEGELQQVNTTLSNKYASLEQNLDGFKTAVSDTYTTKTEFDNLQIGGTNLLPNSGNFKDNYDPWISNGSNITLETEIKYNGYNTIKIHNNSSNGIRYNGYITLRPNTIYTYSITAFATGVVTGDQASPDRISPLHMWVHPKDNPDNFHYEEFIETGHTSIGTSWGRSYIVFKTPDTDDVYVMRPYIYQTSGQIIYVANFKVEEGNKPTDWSPAPEDVQASIDAVDGKFANYSTTTQMNSAINQKANEITSSVSSTYTTKTEFQNLAIGGTNLAHQSNIMYGFLASVNGSEQVTSSLNSNKDYFGIEYIPVRAGDIFTITSYNSSSSIKGCIGVIVYDASKVFVVTNAIENTLNSTTPVSKTFTIANDGYIRYTARGLGELNVKLEKGNKSTDYSPAPEDVQANIDAVDGKFANYSTTTQMNSAIQQKANEITSSVSSTYTTKTEFNNLEVGGRNLIKQSNVVNRNATSASYDKNTATWTLTANAGTGDSWGAGLVLVGDNVRIPYGKTYVLSFEIKVPRACTWSIDVNNYAVTGSSWYGNDNDNVNVRARSSNSLVANQWIKCWSRISNTDSRNTNKVDIYDLSNFGVVMLNETSSMTFQIRNIQGEIGNIPSDYTPAPEDVQSQIDTINTNLTTYATKSELTQTNNSIVAKFSESGGYNLIRNSTGAGGNTNGWTHSGTSMGVEPNDSIGSANRYYLYLDNGTTTIERYAYSSRFKLKPNTTYRFTGYFHNYTKCPSFDVFVLSSTSLPDTDTTTGYTNVHHLIQAASTNNSWKKFTTTFTTPASTKSGILRIDNNGYNQSGTNSNRVHWNCLILTEGEIEVPWSPHPSEIYDGITKIDKNGLEVSQSNYNGYTQMKADGFYVNNGSENVISITKDGSYFKGKVVITSGSTVPTSTLSGTISSSQLNSSITSDISTAKSNASTAVSTANTASTNASNAVKTANTASTNASNAVSTANTASTNASTAVSTANTAKSTADTAKSTADSVKSTVDGGKTNWNNAYNRVNEWAYGAVTGSTTIDGGYIQTNTIVADKIAAGAIISAKIAAGAITADKISAGAITADKLAANAITSKTITGSTITGGTISGATITSETLMKTYGGMYVGSEIWGGFAKNSSGTYESIKQFNIKASQNLFLQGNNVYIYPSTGEVKIGDTSSYDNLRARCLYAQEIVYTDDIRSRTTGAALTMENISMRATNAYVQFTSGLGVVRVKERNHLYLQTGGNTGGDTSAEIRCTRYTDASNYVNIRAHNVCAQNAVYAAGVNVSSDRARKRDIELYSTDALQEVCSTPVYAYHLDTDKDEELKRIGIIMQEAPLDAIDLTGKGVDLYQMVTMLWRAVQQQQEIINELKGE